MPNEVFAHTARIILYESTVEIRDSEENKHFKDSGWDNRAVFFSQYFPILFENGFWCSCVTRTVSNDIHYLLAWLANKDTFEYGKWRGQFTVLYTSWRWAFLLVFFSKIFHLVWAALGKAIGTWGGEQEGAWVCGKLAQVELCLWFAPQVHQIRLQTRLPIKAVLPHSSRNCRK